MQAVDRRPQLPPGAHLAELVAQPNTNPAALFDCAIDFGLVENTDGALRVVASSQPWREGHYLAALGVGQEFLL